VNSTYLCGEAGCLALGVAFVAAILILVLIGWIYVMWQEWVVRYLEEIEQDIRRERHLKATDQDEEAA
jgi:NADH:ubiquinone oxidoreductase subunit 6 (subunit J)